MTTLTVDAIISMCAAIAIFIGVFCLGYSLGKSSIKTFLLFTKNLNDEDRAVYTKDYNKSTYRMFSIGIIHILGSITLMLIMYLF